MKRIGIFLTVVFVIILILCICLMINRNVQTKKLFGAVENNDYEASRKAINSGASVNSRYRLFVLFPNLIDTNKTPLIIACENGNEEIIRLLLDNGADVNKKDNCTNQTPLLAAIGHGNEKAHRHKLAKFMIDQGADIYASTATHTVLMYTVLVSEHDTGDTIREGYELFMYLMEQDVSIEIPFGQENLLTYAARYGSAETVSYLINNSIFDINETDKASCTALITAAKYGNTSIVKLLIELGADKSLTDINGKTAFDYAIENNHKDIEELLQ